MKKEVLLFLLLLMFNIPLIHSMNNTSEEAKDVEHISAPRFFTDTIVNLPDTVYLQTSDCSTLAPLCIDIPINDFFNYQVTINDTSFYQNGIAGCNLDTILFFNYSQLVDTVLGVPITGPYSVQNWAVNGETFTGDFMTIEALVDSMNLWDPTGNWVQDEAIKRIVGGDASNTYSGMLVFVAQTNGDVELARGTSFLINGTELLFGEGVTKVSITTIGPDPVCLDTFFVDVACLPTDIVTIDTLFPGATDSLCLDFSDLGTPVDSIVNICTTDGNADFTFNNDSTCVIFNTLSSGIDSACILACDEFGRCDTTILIIDVQNPTRIFNTELEIIEGQGSIFCLDTTRIRGVDTLYNLCTPTLEHVDFFLDENTYCVSYAGLTPGGPDSLCVVICDDQMVCDTNIISVYVRRDGPGYTYDSIFANQTSTFCDFELFNLNGPVTQIINFCDDGGPNVDFTIDNINNCVTYEALALGQDTACLQFIDNQGGFDTIYHVVSVINPINEVIEMDLLVNTESTFCIDTTELGGNVLDTIFLCNSPGGNVINYDLNHVSLCVDVTTVIPNQSDTICVAVCDEMMTCDTTTYIFNVTEPAVGEAPILSPDSDTTSINTPVQINVCTNDSIPGTITNFFVLPESSGGISPSLGVAFRDADDCIIMYIPATDSCGLDQFTYVVTNEFGSDTTTVSVLIDCGRITNNGDLIVYDAFSPNNDGVNDAFTINGLGNFPNNTLYVYNRWGNQVLKATGYNNDWEGTWNGSDLPDGTYFYVLDLGDGNVESGYVYMHR